MMFSGPGHAGLHRCTNSALQVTTMAPSAVREGGRGVCKDVSQLRGRLRASTLADGGDPAKCPTWRDEVRMVVDIAAFAPLRERMRIVPPPKR